MADLTLVVLDSVAIEKDWGRVFFYQNDKCLDTGDFRYISWKCSLYGQ